LDSYLSFIFDKANEIKDEEKVLKMHTLETLYHDSVIWDSKS